MWSFETMRIMLFETITLLNASPVNEIRVDKVKKLMLAWWRVTSSALQRIKAELNSLTLVPVMDLRLFAQSLGEIYTSPGGHLVSQRSQHWLKDWADLSVCVCVCLAKAGFVRLSSCWSVGVDLDEETGVAGRDGKDGQRCSLLISHTVPLPLRVA